MNFTPEQERNIDNLLKVIELRKAIRRLIASLTAQDVTGEYTRAFYNISEREYKSFAVYYGFGEWQLQSNNGEVKAMTCFEAAPILGYKTASSISIALNRFFDKIAREKGEEYAEEMKREVEKRRKLLHF
jgi:hypothetical protein